MGSDKYFNDKTGAPVDYVMMPEEDADAAAGSPRNRNTLL